MMTFMRSCHQMSVLALWSCHNSFVTIPLLNFCHKLSNSFALPQFLCHNSFVTIPLSQFLRHNSFATIPFPSLPTIIFAQILCLVSITLPCHNSFATIPLPCHNSLATIPLPCHNSFAVIPLSLCTTRLHEHSVSRHLN